MELDVSAAPAGLTLSRSARIAWSGAIATTLLHLALRGLYGYQRDELYFIACAKHLAWGYVDQPPLIALITAISLRLFGDELGAIRILPAVAAGLLVLLAARFTERLGGGPFAQITAMLGVALSPFDLAVGNLLTMNAFEPLLWFGLMWLVYEQITDARGWRWIAIGAVVGVGFLDKWSMALFAFSLLLGVVLSPARRTFTFPAVSVAIALAAVIVTPNVLWQSQHGWPQLQVLHNAEVAKNEPVPPLLFLLEQLPLMNVFAAPLWLAGLWSLLQSRRFSGLAIAYGILVAIELLMHGKVYYLAPVYPALIAIGATAVERLSVGHLRYRAALIASIVVAGFVVLPLATPALPLLALLDYQRALDVRLLKMEHHRTGLVPQQFADQLGWDDLVSTIARAVATLTPAERASAAILTNDYGQAAAIDFFGRRDALPPAISGHNQYYIWGPRGEHRVIVAVGVSRSLLAREYRSIQRVGTYTSRFVLPENTNLPVYVCRGPRMPLERFWPTLRRYL